MVIISIKVIPNARRVAIEQDKNGRIKCYVVCPARENRANNELIGLFAQWCAVSKRAVTIVAGHTSAYKKIAIDANCSLHEIYARLGIDKQQHIFKE